MQYVHTRSAQSLVEVVVGLGILIMVITALARFTIGAFSDVQQSREQETAAWYAAEGLEAVQSIADRRFEDLAPGTYGLSTGSGFYTFAGVSNTWGSYARGITITGVQRNALGGIVSSGGTVDDYTRLVSANVVWPRSWGGTGSVSLREYFTSWQEVRWVIDTLAQFTPGFRNSTVTASIGDGEMQMRPLNNIDSPVSHATVDIDGNSDIQAVEIDRQTDELFLTLGNHIGGAELFVYDISDVTNGNISFLRSAEIGNTSRDLAFTRDYFFVLSHDTANEVRVVRRKDMTLAAQWDLTSNAQPNAIVVDETANRAYVVLKKGAGGEFYIIDISTPEVPSPPVVAEVDFGKDVQDVAIGLGHAYLTTDDTNGELRIVNLENTSLQATCDLPEKQIGLNVEMQGTRLFVTRDVGPSVEFAEYTVDSANPRDCEYILSHIPVSAHVGITPLALAVDTEVNRAFITVADDDDDSVIVINLSTLLSTWVELSGETMCDAVTFLGSHLYVGCRDNTKTLQILKGGVGGSGKSFWGTYTSPAFDGGDDTVQWEKLIATKTGNGTITYRIRTANTEAGLSSAVWVGSDGTALTLYSGTGQTIVSDPNATGTRWIQWKAYLTSNGTQTPFLEDVTVTIK